MKQPVVEGAQEYFGKRKSRKISSAKRKLIQQLATEIAKNIVGKMETKRQSATEIHTKRACSQYLHQFIEKSIYFD